MHHRVSIKLYSIQNITVISGEDKDVPTTESKDLEPSVTCQFAKEKEALPPAHTFTPNGRYTLSYDLYLIRLKEELKGIMYVIYLDFPGGLVVKNLPAT